MTNNVSTDKCRQDPNYPILIEIPGTDAVRLAKDSEMRLIRDAAVGGMRFTRILTRSDYNMATVVAAKDSDHVARKEKAAEVLLQSIFGDQA